MSGAWVRGAVGLLVCAGCASAPPRNLTPGVAVAEFPSAESLRGLGAEPMPARPQIPTLEVDQWRIETVAPNPGDPYPMQTHWDQLFAEVMASSTGTLPPASSARLSPELACAARETARFYVTHGAYPSDSLRNYLIIRCGGTLERPAIAVFYFQAPDAVNERTIESQFSDGVRKLLEPLRALGDIEAGLGYVRGNGRGSFVVYSGRSSAKLAGFMPVAQGVGVTLGGKLEGDATLLLGLANHGRLGVRPCEPDRKLQLPDFSFFCPLDAEGPTRIQIVARRPNRAMFDSVLSALERRSADDGAEYKSLLFGSDAVAADGAAFSSALRVALDEARRAAGVPALAHEQKQSATTEQLAPILFGALSRNDRELPDRIALGLLAGWDVQGSVRDGGIVMSALAAERRPARWLANALEAPLGRFLLLDPASSRVAVGTTELPSAGMGAVVSVYALFQESDLKSAERSLEYQLNRERAAFGKSRVKVRPPAPDLVAALGRIKNQGVSAQAALSDVFIERQRNGDRGLISWSLETLDAQELQWPAEMLLDRIEVELGLTYYKPRGAAWGQYALLGIIHIGVG